MIINAPYNNYIYIIIRLLLFTYIEPVLYYIIIITVLVC